MTDSAALLASLRPEATAPATSGIVELFNLGRDRRDVIPLWVGEGDLPTPAFALDAARRSFDAGETFYTAQRGLPELRRSIARYMTRHHGSIAGASSPGFSPDRFSTTVGGMHALQIALRLISGVGAEVIVPTPAWPNFAGALAAVGATPVEVPLERVERGDGFACCLDVDRLERAVGAATRAIIVNNPGNPTGWTASLDDLRGILAMARRRGLWIIADEIYGRIVFDMDRAPSFHDVMDVDDRVIFVQTLSKNWAMTGMRVGWIEAPEAFGGVIENLIQYSTSGVATPIQRAAIAALDDGEAFVSGQRERLLASRDALCSALFATGRIRFATPPGSFYLFCSIDGFDDSRELAIRLLNEALVGVAPGDAFGVAGSGFLRLCFARDPATMTIAAERLVQWVRDQPSRA